MSLNFSFISSMNFSWSFPYSSSWKCSHQLASKRIIFPSGFSTLSHSLYAPTGSGRFQSTLRETIRSKLSSGNSRCCASIFLMSAGTPASSQFFLAISSIPSE